MGELFLLFPIIMYFFPAIVAGIRRHRNATAITVLNLLLGWTLIGWVVSLVWAFTNQSQPQIIYLPSNEPKWRNATVLEPRPRQVPAQGSLTLRG
jgi:hypothetical protein